MFSFILRQVKYNHINFRKVISCQSDILAHVSGYINNQYPIIVLETSIYIDSNMDRKGGDLTGSAERKRGKIVQFPAAFKIRGYDKFSFFFPTTWDHLLPSMKYE